LQICVDATHEIMLDGSDRQVISGHVETALETGFIDHRKTALQELGWQMRDIQKDMVGIICEHLAENRLGNNIARG